MRFTVLIPTYNRDYLLRQAIQSMLDQTFKGYEILIVDDGSTDMTKKIVSEMMEKDDRIRYLRFDKHQGLVPALNFGNREAKGEIIVKQDSDDMSLPNRLEVIDRLFSLFPDAEFLYHGMYQTHESEEFPGQLVRSYLPALPIDEGRLLKEQYIPGCFAYTKDFIEQVPYRDLHCSEDWMLILDAVLRKRKVIWWNEGLYEYILRPDSNSMIHENTGNYEEDEAKMKSILEKEYGVTDFKYAIRK